MDITKKQTKALIEMYWDRKCLWQVNSEDYKDRESKKKAYHEIVTFLRRIGVRNANSKLVRAKIQNLRRSMRKEKKRIDDSEGSYSPTLWYYDLLTFVNDQNEVKLSNVQTENKRKGTEIELDGENETDNESDTKSDGEHCIDKVKYGKIVIKQNKEVCTLSPEVIPPLNLSQCIKVPDEYEAMGINFAAKIKKMDSRQQIYAELLIQKVLTKGLLGQLEEFTELINVTKADHLTC